MKQKCISTGRDPVGETMKKQSIFITFLVLIGVFFYRQIFLGEVIYCCDNLLINIPSKLFLIEELRQGRFPLWNPYLFSGSPFFADLNLALLYPLNVLYFFLPAFRALTVGVIINFMIALTGMYVFTRSIKLSSIASILAAVVFGFSGTMVVYTNNTPMLQVASLVPWVVWSVHRYMALPSPATLVIAVVLASVQIVAGHPQLTYYTWLLIAGFIVWELTGSRPVMKQNSNRQGETLTYTLLRVVLLIGVVFLLTAVQLLPFFEFVRLSTRAGRGFDYATFDSLHPLSVIRFILPNSVGVLSQGTAWARGGSVYGFTGLVSFLFAVFAPRKNRYVRFFLIAAVVSFLLALGSYTPVFRVAYLLIPGVASFRSPQHFLLLYTFSIAVLAGFGLDELKGLRRVRGAIRVIGVVGGIGGILLLQYASKIPDGIAWLASVYPTRVLEKLLSLSPEMMVTIARLVAANLLISVGLLLTVAFLAGRGLKSATTMVFVVTLIFFELFLFSRNNLLSISNEVATRWLTTVEEKAQPLRDVDFRQYRIHTDPSIYPYPGEKQFGVFDWDKESAWQAEILRPNLNMVARLPAIDGYASLIYRDYADYLNKNQADPTGVTLDDPVGTEKRRLGVGANASPRFFMLINGKESIDGIHIEAYTPNEVRVSVAAKEAGRLVFADTNYPGWQGLLDGKPVPIQPFEAVFKSIAVSAGTHTVTFRYYPKSVQLGLAMSGLGVLVIVVLLWKRGKI